MKLFSSYSIKRKLATIITFTTAIALLIAILAFLIHDIFTKRAELENDLDTQANIIGDNIAAAFLFGDPDTGNEILSALKHDPSIVAAEVNSSDGKIFVHYHNNEYGDKYLAEIHNINNSTINTDLINVSHPVVYNNNVLGTVIILASKKEITDRLIYFVVVSLVVLIMALGIAIILSSRLQRLIYLPIQHLADIAKRVSEEKDYHIRAKIYDDDEIGSLAEDFNDMLAHIQERDENLETLVDKRTTQVKQRNEELNIEVSERIKAQERLEDSETRFKSAFYSAAIGMALVKKDHRISQVNKALCNMLGYSQKEIIGTLFKDLTFVDDIYMSEEQHNKLVKGELSHYQLEKRYLDKSGNIIWGLLNVSSVRDINNEFLYAIAQIQDITEAHHLSDELSYQASHDALTDLVNRREFERRLERVLINVEEEESEHALLFIDLDQFKVINDTCGHISGDELLHQLANLMEDKIRQRDTLARLGGDEFGVLMEHCNMDQAMRVANVIREAVENYRFVWGDNTFGVGASIGLTPINITSGNITEILKQADAACYAAKESGRNRVHMYHDGDTSLAKRHGEMQWVARINSALEDNRFHLYAQPIMHTANSDVTHYELLLRMEDEDGAIIPPGAFLPAAERYNLISKLDRWVLDAAFQWLNDVPESREFISFCSINLSGQNLGDEQFRTYVINKLKESNIQPDKVCFEITETAAIANLANAMDFIITLKDMGCLFALDDFGSGVSSFAYLKNLPVDYLKIDGMFVKDIVDDPIDFAMVKSINEIGHVMGKKTIAEFVENEAILNKLREIGVDYAQGYGIGMPVPLEFISSNKLDN
jgi:diguanylate cyclase (GGDEF)-like protein/PAS domain S-box-containing protein